MVIQGDFKIELVEAATKKPFREHYYQGKIYVEVEPDAEYYISWERIGTLIKQPFVVTATVDGKRLGWQEPYLDLLPRRDVGTLYSGFWRNVERNGHVETEEVSLKFDKASRMDNQPSAECTMTGKVELNLYLYGGPLYCDPLYDESHDDSLYNPYYRHHSSHGLSYCNPSYSEQHLRSQYDPYYYDARYDRDYSKSDPFFYTSNETTVSSTIAVNDKSVRSVQGTFSKYIDPCDETLALGPRIGTITLHYCTVPGLIQVGVLPKPPNWKVTLRSFTTPNNNDNKKPLPPLLVQPQRMTAQQNLDLNGRVVSNKVKEYDFFDLSILADSDSEEDGDDLNSQRESVPRSPPTPSSLVSEERAPKKPRIK